MQRVILHWCIRHIHIYLQLQGPLYIRHNNIIMRTFMNVKFKLGIVHAYVTLC